MKYRTPHANINIGVHTTAGGGSSACSPNWSKPPEIDQNARLTTTAEQKAMTVLFLPNSIARGIPIKAITRTVNGAAYLCCNATASDAVSAPRTFNAAT